MLLKFNDFASQRLVTSDLVNISASSDVITFESVENYQNSALDIKKWRIVHTIAAYKSDDS